MPSATATLFLNVSAIQALCAGASGTNGTALRYTSGGAPSLTHGASGDFTFDLSHSPLYYDLYGPKTTTWPTTAIRLTTFAETTAYVTTLAGSSGWQTYLSYGGTLGQGQLSSLKIRTPSTSTVYPLDIVANNATIMTVASTGAASLSGGWYINYPTTTNLLLPFEDTIKTGTNCIAASGDAFIRGALVVTNTSLLSGNAIFGEPSLTSTVSTRKNIVYNKNSGFLGVGINWSELSTVSAYGSVFINGGPNSLPVTLKDSSLYVVYSSVADPGLLNFAASGTRAAVNVHALTGLPANFTVGGTISASGSITSNLILDTLGNRLLTTRQSGIAKLGVDSTSAQIVDAYNTLIDKLTAHGLVYA